MACTSPSTRSISSPGGCLPWYETSSDSVCARSSSRRRLVAVHACRLATQVRTTVAPCAPAATTRYTTPIAASSPVFAPAIARSTKWPRMIGPVRGSTVPITSAPMRPTSARRSGHRWARKTRRGSIAVGSMEPIDATPAIPVHTHTFLCAYALDFDRVGYVETTSKPRARATGIWRGSNVQKVIGFGSRSAAARWMASTVRTGWVRPISAARSRHT